MCAHIRIPDVTNLSVVLFFNFLIYFFIGKSYLFSRSKDIHTRCSKSLSISRDKTNLRQCQHVSVFFWTFTECSNVYTENWLTKKICAVISFEAIKFWWNTENLRNSMASDQNFQVKFIKSQGVPRQSFAAGQGREENCTCIGSGYQLYCDFTTVVLHTRLISSSKL